MIRLATLSDINSIMNLVFQTIDIMKTENNPQWDEKYPTRFDFLKDSELKQLFVYKVHNQIGGLICLNTDEPLAYQTIPWSLSETALVLHRMTVNPTFRCQGIGTKLMQFAERFALENNLNYLKTDTYSTNQKMNYLFVRQGYVKRGELYMNQKPQTFYGYEKILINK